MSSDEERAQEAKPSAGELLLTAVKHPKINKISAAALRKWMIAREEYITALKAQCKTEKKDWEEYCIQVKDSFEPPGYFEHVVTNVWDLPKVNDEVTEEEVVRKIQKVIETPRLVEDKEEYTKAF